MNSAPRSHDIPIENRRDACRPSSAIDNRTASIIGRLPAPATAHKQSLRASGSSELQFQSDPALRRSSGSDSPSAPAHVHLLAEGAVIVVSAAATAAVAAEQAPYWTLVQFKHGRFETDCGIKHGVVTPMSYDTVCILSGRRMRLDYATKSGGANSEVW